MNRVFSIAMAGLLFAISPVATFGQGETNLETKLKGMSVPELAKKAGRRGDPRRGALVFHKSAAACVKCHADGSGESSPLGPAMTDVDKKEGVRHIIESILYPSKKIKKGFDSLKILTADGNVVSGLIVSEDEKTIVLRDAADLQREIVVDRDEVEQQSKSDVSLMPEGLVSALREEREFYDLVRYLEDVAEGGPERARQLRPSPELLVVKDDTRNLDHAGILSELDATDLERGRQIYVSHCINCHGADGNKPTLATARAFGKDKLKFGADPLSMLGTLTIGNGLMAAMQHLSPKERYQVIHFIRETFMKGRNPEYQPVNATYLGRLPEGSESGEFLVGNDRDYGPVLGSQLGKEINNSLTFRMPGNITLNYDLHRFRLGGVWTDGFLDLSQTQHYRQRGERMPEPVGTPISGLRDYAWELGGSFEISDEIKPPRGPVRRELAHYKGHYIFDDQAVLSYDIDGRPILETITSDRMDVVPTVQHTYHIDAGRQALRLCVAKQMRPGAANVQSDNPIALVPNRPAAKREGSTNTNQALFIVPAKQSKKLDLGIPGRTVVVRFKTNKGGTLIASAPEKGEWAPDGKTLYIRGKRMVFDIGWVGAISGKTAVADGQWHTAAVVVDEDQTRLYVDGKLEGSKANFRRGPVKGHVLKLGATATNFGGDFSGDINWATIYDQAMTAAAIQGLADNADANLDNVIWNWNPAKSSTVDAAPSPAVVATPTFTANALVGDTEGLNWSLEDGRVILTIPPRDSSRVFRLIRCSVDESQIENLTTHVAKTSDQEILDPKIMTRGGPTRWPERLTTTGSLGESINGYALDTIPLPTENPWNSWIRTSALDFFENGRCVVTTHGGDVYLVDGIDDELEQVTWKRYASGLFEPFGVRVVNNQIYVTCRDGIKRLHDVDGNDEADFVEAFWIDDDVSCMFHAYNFDLQTDSLGNFYFAKAGQYTQHRRPGTIMKVPPSGGSAEVVAWGIRTPNGMGKLDGDRFTVSDNQGPWMPAGKISLVKPNGFFGNMPINKEQDEWLKSKHGGQLPESFDEPFIWMPQELDNSCGGQVWAGDDRWGPLSGRLIHSSFGKGWLYYLSLQEIDGIMQSSIVSLPHQWQAGVMRLRVNPADGQMYGAGLSGWQGPQGGKDGCLQRLRFTGENVRMIDQVRVVPGGIELTFNFEVSDAAMDPDAWAAEMWDYLWSKKYGSDQFSVLNPGKKGRDNLEIQSVKLSEDRRTVTLIAPDLQACDQIRLEMGIDDANGNRFNEEVYLTVHAVPAE